MAGFRLLIRYGTAGVLLLLSWFASPVFAQQASAAHELTRIQEVKTLAPADAARPYAVRLRGVVTTPSGWKNSFFLQDGASAISVDRNDAGEVHSGEEIEVEGVSAAGKFAPVIVANKVTEVVDHAALPMAKRADYADLATGANDSRWVEIHGIVHAATISQSWGRRVLFLSVRVGRDTLSARVIHFDGADYSRLVDASVVIEGACGTIFNEKRQLTGVRLFVPSIENVHVEEAAADDAFNVAETPVDQIFRYGSTNRGEHRIKVSGIVSYQDAVNGRLYLQNGEDAIVVRTSITSPVAPGDRVEALGFLEGPQISITLSDATYRKVGRGIAPLPRAVRAADMIQTQDNFKFAPFDGLLTQTEGQLVEKVRRGDQETWVMREADQIFEVVFHSKSDAEKLENVNVGSRVQITGVSRTELNQRLEPRSFLLLVRDSSDVVLLESRWWSAKRSLWLAGFLVVACLLMLAWVMQTRRVLREIGVRQQADSSIDVQRMKRNGPRFTALTVISIAALVIVGWSFNFEILQTIFPSSAPMYPNAALALLFAGVGLLFASTHWRWSVPLKEIFATGAGLIGLVTLLEYALQLDLGVDERLFRDVTSAAGVAHGRMAPATAIALVLLAVSMLLVNRRKFVTASQMLAGVAGLLCILNLLGHLYGEPALFAFGSQIGMAIHTMIACLLLCGGILALRADRGLMSLITSDASGGVMARVLLPAAIVLPAILGWLRWYGQFSLKLYDTAAGLTLFTSSVIVVFVIMTLASAALLNRSDTERARMQYEASHDALTKVMNRHGILEQMRVEMSRCFREKKTVGVALVDVDRFKLVNDELGHHAGDEVLKEVAMRLKNSLRAYDGVGRYGGEEFLLVLPGCDLESAMGRAEALRAAVANDSVKLSDSTRAVTISIGVSVLEISSRETREELIRRADVALYAAKVNGRNQVQPFVAQEVREVAPVS